MSAGAKYLWVLLGTAAVLLGLILGLNLLLGERALGGPETTRQASEWQQQSKGVTYAPPITASRRFKALRLKDRMQEINAVAFGSSTSWGVTADALPEQYHLYNFATTGNPLVSIIGEARYLMNHHPDRFSLMVVPLEWAIGSIFDRTPVFAVDLSPATVLAVTSNNSVSVWRKIQDALSYPKVLNLLHVIRGVLSVPDVLGAAGSVFLAYSGGPEYRCADGSVARDFDIVNQGKCAGFRFDGSWSFGGEKRLTKANAATLARAAAAPSSKFFRSLCATGGEPNPEYLASLSVLAEEVGSRGGQMLFVLPPLVPGLEAAVAADAEGGGCLERAKAVLHSWAQRSNVVILDAGRSENYRCIPEEFIDEHHAYPECYRRALRFYFEARQSGRALAGLIQP